jgi:hypothetical protein
MHELQLQHRYDRKLGSWVNLRTTASSYMNETLQMKDFLIYGEEHFKMCISIKWEYEGPVIFWKIVHVRHINLLCMK